MFSLIITLIAIGLVIAIALATMHYGGTAFSQSSETADVAKIDNQLAQISGAAIAYHAETGAYAPDVNSLVTAQYLKAAIPGFTVGTDQVEVAGLSYAQCLAFNQKRNVSSVPTCSEVTDASAGLCCTE